MQNNLVLLLDYESAIYNITHPITISNPYKIKPHAPTTPLQQTQLKQSVLQHYFIVNKACNHLKPQRVNRRQQVGGQRADVGRSKRLRHQAVGAAPAVTRARGHRACSRLPLLTLWTLHFSTKSLRVYILLHNRFYRQERAKTKILINCQNSFKIV